jgi:hypothetical protein
MVPIHAHQLFLCFISLGSKDSGSPEVEFVVHGLVEVALDLDDKFPVFRPDDSSVPWNVLSADPFREGSGTLTLDVSCPMNLGRTNSKDVGNINEHEEEDV